MDWCHHSILVIWSTKPVNCRCSRNLFCNEKPIANHFCNFMYISCATPIFSFWLGCTRCCLQLVKFLVSVINRRGIDLRHHNPWPVEWYKPKFKDELVLANLIVANKWLVHHLGYSFLMTPPGTFSLN
jgi:hypothetical protein